ncbi:MAG: transglycosylase domain-containing protein, partial [Bacteroidota bacterium]
VVNKFREIILAKRIEKVYSKDEILQLYLNTVPFGGAIYGVDVASKQYFNKPPVALKMEEAAVLAGMLKATTYYHPVRHKERARERRDVVLKQMQKYEYISATTMDSLIQLPVTVDYNYESNNVGLATYFREHIRQELGPKLKFLKKNQDDYGYSLYTEGLKIYTTIHSKMQAYAEEAVFESMKITQEKFDKHWEGRQPWPNQKFIDDLIKQSDRYKKLKKAGKSENEIQKIFNTPIDMRLFSWDGEVDKFMSPLDSIKYVNTLLNAGFLLTDRKTGDIRAWVGGIDHRYFKYDHVVSKRQVGSTFKPFVFAAALYKGLGPCVFFKNELVTYEDYNYWTPKNASPEYGGYYSMEGSIAHSINASSVDAMMQVGVDTVVDLALKIGYQEKDVPRLPSIALGALSSNVYEMVNAYRIFPNKGKYTPLKYIKKITNNKGELVLDFEAEEKEPIQAIDTIDAILMNEILKEVTRYGTAAGLRYRHKLSQPFAAKTGTSQDQADAWFLGYSPDLAGGAWVGAQSPQIHFRTINEGGGARNALPIFGRFFEKLYADPNFEDYKNRRFEYVSGEIMELLECPDYVESLDDYYKDEKVHHWLDDIYGSRDSLRRAESNDRMQQVVDEIRQEREARKQRN